MKLINNYVWHIPQEPGLLGVYKQIERAGRTSYKSEDKITENSAEKFVNMLMERGHLAPFEFGTIYLKFPTNIDPETIMFYDNNPYSKVTFDDEWYYVTTNSRVIIENDYRQHLQYLCDPTDMHELRFTVGIICSRSIANEIVRHRAFSYVQESTRYCNYSKDKFGGEVAYIIPHWMDELKEGYYNKPYYSILDDKFHMDFIGLYNSYTEDLAFGKDVPYKYLYRLQNWANAEDTYFREMTIYDRPPQDTRDTLPLGLKTELVMCGYLSDWDHFLSLRCAKDAHPDMQIVANKIKETLCL